jgi:sn-glycerol 3-phosphate transport system substrate-binding protein
MLSVGGAWSAPVELDFYYPVAVGGPITKIVEDMIDRFEAKNPDIKVNPVYSGTNPETLSKVLTAARAGKPPAIAVMAVIDMFTLIDEGVIAPIDSFITSDEDKAWLDGFEPAFMWNSQYDGKTWSVPFSRSTTIFYWNKDAFKTAGLDPDAGPKNWQEIVDFATKLTVKDATGNVTQWGVQAPSTLVPYWILQGYAAQNGVKLGDETGTKTYFDAPEVVEALQFWADLSQKYKVMKPGVIEWATNPKDFLEGRAAMITTSSGNLTNIKNTAKFPIGVGMMPQNKQIGAPVGGSNMYIMKDAPAEQQAAAFKLAKFFASDELAAEWSIKTGYVASRKDAWETEAMKAYVKEFPLAEVAHNQLPYTVPEFSTHESQRVTRAIDDAIQATLIGSKTAEAALKDAQQEAERILKPYQD